MKPIKFAFASAALLSILAAVFVVRARQSPSAQEIITRQSPSAEEIIANMKKTYATCRTYRDRGTVKSEDKISHLGQIGQTFSGTFTTAFARPDRYRFALDLGSSFIVWGNGKESRFWNGIDKTDEAKAFDLSTAMASGMSEGATSNVTLLLPSDKDRPRFPGGKDELQFHAADAKRIADAKVEGDACYCLQVTKLRYVQKFYVSKSTFLLRELETDSQFNAPEVGTMKSHSEVIWKPVINEAIPASALEYNPPR